MPSRAFSILLVLMAVASATVGTLLALRQDRAPSVVDLWLPPEQAGPAFASAAGQQNGSREQMTQFREQHKFTFQLITLTNGIQRLEDTPQHLTPAQARAILNLLDPLCDQPKLTQDQAKATIRALQRVLTIEQRTQIASQRASRQSRGGFQGRGGARPSGGQRTPFDPSAMKDFNPFSSAGEGSALMGRRESFESLLTSLEQHAAPTEQPRTGRPSAPIR